MQLKLKPKTLSWQLLEGQLHFLLNDTKVIHSGPVTKRHMARIVYVLVTDYKLTIGEAKDLWYQMVKTDKCWPPFTDNREYFMPAKAKFCTCGHFAYEHSADLDSKEGATPLVNAFGYTKLGCLRCSCKEFKQLVKKEKENTQHENTI